MQKQQKKPKPIRKRATHRLAAASNFNPSKDYGTVLSPMRHQPAFESKISSFERQKMGLFGTLQPLVVIKFNCRHHQ